MPRFGLIGRTLKHSFSKEYFSKKFGALGLDDHEYLNYELESIEHYPVLLRSETGLRGLNVTVPYKELIIPFLDEIDQEAEKIGAVNCIRLRNGKAKGFNTDAYGFRQSIKPFLEPVHERALVLGTGGSGKAVAHALKSVGVDVYFASRTKKGSDCFTYEELNEMTMNAFKLIVNTTPLGLYPSVEECPPLPYQYLSGSHLCYDLIYNPPQTLFLRKAQERGAQVINGLSMLQLQAEKSWEIWNAP